MKWLITNSVFKEELFEPSKFNLIAGISLICLIILCLIVVSFAALKNSKQQEKVSSKTEKGGEGF